MLDKAEVTAFFDERASRWDAMEISDERIINILLDNAGVSDGKKILDAACGTGVLVPYYISRNVGSVTGIDISPNMIERARGKYTDPRVRFICMDAETSGTLQAEVYDVVMIYNAYPHFSDPDALFRSMCACLAVGGTITVAHGMSRENIEKFHTGAAAAVSNGLPEADDLAELMGRYVEVTKIVSNGEMYQVVGRKRA